MITIADLDAAIEKFVQELEREQSRIAAAVAEKGIADGSGYWKRAHHISLKIATARLLREALIEAAQ
jgi:hypothetical protein